MCKYGLYYTVFSFQSQSTFCCSGATHNGINTAHFQGQKEYEVDILLNMDERKYNACVVGNCVDGKEAKVWNLKVSNSGYVPYINIYYHGTKVQLAQIPVKWYGQKKDFGWNN